MHWPSPWGEGYPGWHIECSAMSLEYLGDTIDIHTGGEDHIFPHHEAEIAQSEGTTGKPFSRFFMHERHILVDGQKMSKSKGNFYTLQDIVDKGFSPMDLRLLYLSAHYRSQMNFTWDSLSQARKNRESLASIRERLTSAPEMAGTDVAAESKVRFLAAMEDDLNTPLALSILLGFVNRVNAALDRKESFNMTAAAGFLDDALGLFGMRFESSSVISDSDEIRDLVARRERARKEKDFALADRLRDELADRGIQVRDSVSAKDIVPKPKISKE
ncbi:MAG: class I tRNA ligase family protein [Candidatus Moranbacteria bacterium]|nr:class I tRNA ligase family protein [Candidatus Moranbacteria bacterium]